MFKNRYLIDDAIKDAARAAYLATLLETGEPVVEKYNGDPASIASLQIVSTLPSRLNRLKRSSP